MWIEIWMFRLRFLCLPALAPVLVVATVGCSLDPITLAGRPCPCAQGWKCNEAINACVRPAGLDALEPDAAAGRKDGGAIAGDASGGGPGGGNLNTDAGNGVDGGPQVVEIPEFKCAELTDIILCDDFETALDPWNAGLNQQGQASVSRVQDRAYKSEHSLKTALLGTGKGHVARKTALLSAPITAADKKLNMHFMFYLPEDAPVQSFHLAWLARNGAGDGNYDSLMPILQDVTRSGADPGLQFDDGVNAPDLRVQLDRTNGVTGKQADVVGDLTLLRNYWNCIHVEAELAEDETGTVTLSINGKESKLRQKLITAPPGGYSIIQFGLSSNSLDQQPIEAWYDDILVTSGPLPPCEKAP